MLGLRAKKADVKSTPFADFFHSAPSREKKRLYAQVIDGAAKRQKDQMERAKVAHV